MLTEFNRAFLDFEHDAYSLLHECSFDPGKELTSLKVQIQAQSLATDLGYLAMVMRDLHQNAIQDVSNEMDRDNAEYDRYLKEQMVKQGSNLVLDDVFFRNQPRREKKISIALAKLGSAFKAFLFPVRAYQDALYKIALRINGETVGGKSSMTRAVDVKTRTFITTNAIGQLLAVAVPEYATWFGSLRAQRDFIKYGAAISYSTGKTFVTGETTVAIKLHTSSEGEQPAISLDDVSRSLRMSTALTKAIIYVGVSRGKFKARASQIAP